MTIPAAEMGRVSHGGQLSGYGESDVERYVEEQHSGPRGDFTRDRARVLHSSAWRRLAAKTQVLSPAAGIDFARNRLTHSLEVAQIGRELAASLGLSRDVVDAACLAHDLGHPPFGHNGERVLNAWASAHGGFEGNAQTLRILTRLEPKRFSNEGNSVGLNLTRATLDASCKYPWSLAEAPHEYVHRAGVKFGYFSDDEPVFRWLRAGATPGVKCVEAQAMDLSDDIAYSVHDFEDAVVGGYIDPAMLTAREGHNVLIGAVADWADGSYSHSELADAYSRIAATHTWLRDWTGSRRDQAQLKNFTSDMIGRFAGRSIRATLRAAGSQPLARYGANIVVPEDIRAEIAVLKGVVAAYVMQIDERQATYEQQQDVLRELLEALWQAQESELEPAFAADFLAATNESEARRAIVDQVASLTDQGALSWHARLCNPQATKIA